MTTLALIGSGNIGSGVARLAVAAGHDVVLSNSRGPDTLTDLVEELGPRARAATAEEAAGAGDVVVVTVPLGAVPTLPAEPLAGRLVLDTSNYYPERDGNIAELDDRSTTTSAWVQQHLPGARVVKVFNNIFYGHLPVLARPAGSPERSALPIAGDDAQALAEATAFLDTLGYDAVVAGDLAQSWRFEPGTPAYGAVYFDPDADASGARPGQAAGMPAASPTPAADIHRVLDAAVNEGPVGG
ncbi:NADP oxidoreductase coenzyme F420-dependent [Nocardioides dokdonensis FR1436]|uniref:NADP oxidoreductase coenzyme F420-dependent n=1 Tax=Nocardioides dokdonensis FR1436 TaxID=1300347 RepID=A0A1A9GN01_9ACTN|nr:NAD(P)-binding domain-containing protein [Nocardioides dokdonensis]ANH39040.1 NADP oxidoreductase coenzyme F420-dependent [Nocardioides dokdonensis FR1436]